MAARSDSLDLSRRAVLGTLGIGGAVVGGLTVTERLRSGGESGEAGNRTSDSDDPTNESDGGSVQKPIEPLLRSVAADTWLFFEEFASEDTGLVPDRIDVSGSGYTEQTSTSPANVGLQLLATVAAPNLESVETETARRRASDVLDALERVETWNGLFYRWYDIGDGSIADGRSGWWEISTVDNGWLAAGLVATGGAFPSLRDRADALLGEQDFGRFYDPEVSNPFEGGEPFGQLYGGFDARDGEDLGFHYGVFNAETRIASYVAIGKGDVPSSHWWDTFRTFPPEWDQQGDPEGEFRTYDGDRVWEGHYEHDGKAFVPSWGGSMFESVMPSLVIPEREYGTDALGVNNRRQVQLQIDHADQRGYDAWGFSPCATPDGYAEFGVTHAGIEGYDRDDAATPHATLLGLEYAEENAVADALSAYVERELEGEYGFYDSMGLVDDWRTDAYLALDQGISLVAIVNYLADGAVRSAFTDHPVGSEPTDLLEAERFTI